MILMTLEIETFNVEIYYFQWDGTYGYKSEPNYNNEGFKTLEEVFKAINEEVRVLVEEYGALCCFPDYEALVPELIDCEF